MNIGIPKEIMTGEARIALTPDACSVLAESGCVIYVQHNAGKISGYADSDYQQNGAVIVETARQLYESAQLIVKVKQPLDEDLHFLNNQHILFSYLHLAADVQLINALCDIGLCAIPFESITDSNGSLPLLAPMSQVAGRIAAIRGASLLFLNRGGNGVLLGGVDGSESGRVVVLGAGVAGGHAAAVAALLGAQVDVLDLDEAKLQLLKQQYPAINTFVSTPEVIESVCIKADLVIGAVLLAGRRAPVILKKSVVKQMNPGSVIVDISIDQGGCVEGIHATSSEELCYVENDVIHSAVPNMPATVARTSTQSLSSAVLPYVLEIANTPPGQLAASKSVKSQALHSAIAINQGQVVDSILQQELE